MVTKINHKVSVLKFAGVLNKIESEKLTKSIKELRNLSKKRISSYGRIKVP